MSVALDGFSIEIGVRIELGVVLVCEKYPVAFVLGHSRYNEQDHDGKEELFFHIRLVDYEAKVKKTIFAS